MSPPLAVVLIVVMIAALVCSCIVAAIALVDTIRRTNDGIPFLVWYRTVPDSCPRQPC